MRNDLIEKTIQITVGEINDKIKQMVHKACLIKRETESNINPYFQKNNRKDENVIIIRF